MRPMNTLGIGLIAIFCTLLTVLPVVAGWQPPPRPINPDAYNKPIDPHANSGGRRIVRIDDTIIALECGTSLVIYLRQSRRLERCEPLKAVV